MFRSWLFVAGNKEKHLNKAASLPADVIVFDLEDSVAPLEKETARLLVKEAVSNIKGKSKFVRVNNLQSMYFLQDINEVVTCDLTGVVVPKVTSKDDILIVDYFLSQLEQRHHLPLNSFSILPLIETAKGLYHAHEIASASVRISKLAFGAEDFMLDMNISEGNETELLYARSKLVEVSKAANIDPPIDTVFTNFEDVEGLKRSSMLAKRLGFQGKLVIHPNQLSTVNKVFSPTLEEIKKARKIVEAYDKSIELGKGAIQLDGDMIDIPISERARKILSSASMLESESLAQQNTRRNKVLPLEGITIVSIEQAIAAPFATRQLADLGARVIKIERPKTGDFARNYDHTVKGLSSHFVWCNRSKESIVLDLKSEQGKEALNRLLKKTDVFVHNLTPGAFERMGFIPEQLIEKYPKLIVCSLSGYGKGGPYEKKKAYDLLIQCEAGLVSITGSEKIPSKVGISIADIAAGMYAYTGILTALLNRTKTGKGTIMEISMLEALGEWMGYPIYYTAYGGTEPKRTGANHSTIYPYGPFICGDQKKVFIGLQNEREWEQFCHFVLEDVDLSSDPRFENNSKRSSNREELKRIIEFVFGNLTCEEVINRLEIAKIANARLNTMEDFFHHPQLKARNRWVQVQTPVGEVAALKHPVTMSGVDTVVGAVPKLGEHTDSILREIGMTINDKE